MKRCILSFLMVALLVGCTANGTTKKEESKTKKNVCDIECNDADLTEYEMMKGIDHVFKEITFAESNKVLEDKTFTGIVYYGFPTCPWCEEAMPIMNDVAKKLDLEIYYVNKRSQDSIDHPEEEEKAVKILDEAIGLSEDEEGIKKLYVPEVIVVKEGKIIKNHRGTFDGHNAHEREMNEDEKLLLKNIYKNMFVEIK